MTTKRDVTGPLSVLLVEDDTWDAWLVERTFQDWVKGRYRLDRVDRLSEATMVLAGGHVDLVLLDLFLPDGKGIESIQRIHTQAPWVPIVVLTSLDDETLALEAMKIGAQDYLIKGEINAEALDRALKFAYQRQSRSVQLQQEDPQIVAVVGAKGGIGKTTVALALASQLEHTCQVPVAVVDLDLEFGDVATISKVPSHAGVAEYAELHAMGEHPDCGHFVSVASSGLHVVQSPTRPELADIVTKDDITSLVHDLAKTHPYVITDTSSYMNDVTLQAIDSADKVVVVTDLRKPSVKDTKALLTVLRSMGVPTQNIFVVANQVGPTVGVQPSELAAALECPITTQIPYDPTIAVEAEQKGAAGEPPPRKFTQQISVLASLLHGTGSKSTTALTA